MQAILKGWQLHQVIKTIKPSKKKFSLIFEILVIMNSLIGVWSDTYIPQIIIQQELEKLAKILQEKLILKA